MFVIQRIISRLVDCPSLLDNNCPSYYPSSLKLYYWMQAMNHITLTFLCPFVRFTCFFCSFFVAKKMYGPKLIYVSIIYTCSLKSKKKHASYLSYSTVVPHLGCRTIFWEKYFFEESIHTFNVHKTEQDPLTPRLHGGFTKNVNLILITLTPT